MKCPNCDSEIMENEKLCENCGTEVSVSEVVEEVTETPLQQPVPKKKKSKVSILIVILAIVAILGSVFFIFKDAIVGRMMFLMPASTQLKEAYKSTAEDLGKISGVYVTELKKNLNKSPDTNFQGKIAVTVDEDVLKDSLGLDLGGINRVYADYELISNAKDVGINLQLGLEERDVISLDMTMDMEQGVMTILVPELNESAIEMEFDTAEMGDIYSETEEMREMLQILTPDEKFAETFLPKYVGAALVAIDEAEREKETIEVGDVSQKATRLTVTLDAEMIEKMGKAIVEEIKKDEEFEKYMKGIYEASMEMSGEEADDWDKEYDELIDDIEEMFVNLKDTEDIKEGIEFVTWVNSKNQIIGMEFGEVVSWTCAKEKEKIGFELVIVDPEEDENIAKILLQGKYVDAAFSGTIDLFGGEEKVFTLDIEKYQITADGATYITEFTFTEEMLEEMTGQSVLLEDITLRLEQKVSGSDVSSVYKVIVGDKEYVTMESSAKFSEEKKEVVKPKNIVEQDEWYPDPTKLMENLEKAGITEDILYSLFTGGFVNYEVEMY